MSRELRLTAGPILPQLLGLTRTPHELMPSVSAYLRVILAGTWLLIGAMGLDAVALATGLGWVAIVLFQLTVFLLGQRAKGRR